MAMKIDYILMRIMYMVFFISQNRIHKIKNWINNVWHAVWKDDFHKIGQMQNRKFVVFIWIYMNDFNFWCNFSEPMWKHGDEIIYCDYDCL